MDLIWFCFLIPIIAVLIGALGFTRKMVWWEYLMVFGITSITITSAYYITANSLTKDTEHWGSYGVSAVHSERWNEYISKTCSREECSESGENRSCRTEHYDCSYVDDHPEYWEITDNLGASYRITQTKYREIVGKWGNERKIRRHRGCHTICGDVYGSNYQRDTTFKSMVPITREHSYENRVKASTSVFKFQDVDSMSRVQYGLYEHPGAGDMFNHNPILGTNSPWATHKLNSLNALYGSSKQLRMMVLIFDDKPISAAHAQEALWIGGKKNEFILCVGKSGPEIRWAKVISWTENFNLKLQVERDVVDMGEFNIIRIVDYMGDTVPKGWKRKEFKDFEYLSIDIPMSATLWTFAITLIVTAGLMLFSVLNDHGIGNDEQKRFPFRRFR